MLIGHPGLPVYSPLCVNSTFSSPYDVIDAAERAALLERSPNNVVEIDLPQAEGDADPYEHAAETMTSWLDDGVLVADSEPSIWALTQDYTTLRVGSGGCGGGCWLGFG